MIAKLNSILGEDNKWFVGILCLFSLGYPIYSWFGTWCLIALTIVWLFHFSKWRQHLSWRHFHWPFLLYFFIHVLGLIYSADIIAGLEDLQSKSALLLVPLILGCLTLSSKQVKTILAFFAYGTLLANACYLLFAGYQYFILGAPSDTFFYTAITEPFKQHPAYIASYNIFVLIYFLDKVIKEKKPFSKMLPWILAITFLWSMILLYSGRMQLITLLVISVIFLLWKSANGKRKLMYIFSIPVLLFVTYSATNSLTFTKERIDRIQENMEKKRSTNIRIDLWESTLDFIKSNAIIGVGIGDVDEALVQEYIKTGKKKLTKSRLNLHNQYLQSIAALGIFGLAAYVLLLLIPTFRGFQAGEFIVIALYLIFIFGTLTECMMETQRGSVWLAVLGSLFWNRENMLK